MRPFDPLTDFKKLEGTAYIFRNIVALLSTLQTEEQCHELLAQLRWNGHPICKEQTCLNSENNTYIQNRKVYQCSHCNAQFSAKQGTIFHSSTVPLKTWFTAIFLFVTENRGVSSCQLAKNIGVTQKTAWRMLQKFRAVLDGDNSNLLLSGIIEIDEAFLGATKDRDLRLSQKVDEMKKFRIEMDAEGKNEKAARLSKEKENKKKLPPIEREDKLAIALQNCTSVEQERLLMDRDARIRRYQKVHYRKNIFGLYERRGNLVLIPVGRHGGDICAETLIPIIKKYVSPDSHIMSDENPSYNELSELFRKHSTVNHSNKEYFKKGTTTNHIEGVWNLLKKLENGTYFHFSWKYTERYLNEFQFRFNNRDKNPGQMCELFMTKAFQRIDSNKLTNFKDNYIHIPR